MDQRSRFRTNFRGLEQHDKSQTASAAQTAASPQHQTHTKQSAKTKKLGFFFGRRWLLILIALLVVGLGVLTYGYVHTKNQLNAAKNPAAAGKTQTEQIVNQVSKYLELPTGETPTLATVNDVSKLKSQTFFRNAQNGDKVLIYTKSGRALLYRPSTKKIIEYAPVNLGQGQ
jgi:hypothetical protein